MFDIMLLLARILYSVYFIGVFMTNLAARNEKIKGVALKSLVGNFPALLSISIPEDINEIVLGLPDRSQVVSSINEAKRNKELNYNVDTQCHVAECVLKRLSRLTQWAGACSHGEIDTDGLRSKLLGFLSRVNCFYL